MKRYVPFFLVAILFLGLFLGLEPLLSFPLWGSDSGEYYFLTSYLVAHGHFLLTGYTGWGFGYPDFPGIFIVGGGLAEAFGVSPLTSLQYIVPIVGAFACLPLFLMIRKMGARDSVALLAAALASVAFPRIFILAHSIPDTFGDLLAVAGVWMFLEQRRDVRWLVPLGLTLSALIISHHLSSYFFLLIGTSMVVGLELVSPRRWSVRFPLREFGILGVFTAALFSYWIFYATDFNSILTEAVPGIHLSPGSLFAALSVGTIVLLAGLAILVHLRRTILAPRRSIVHPKWPTRRKLVRDASILGVCVFGLASLLIFFPVPGTNQTIPATDVLWFSPLLLLVPLTAGGLPLTSMTRLGPLPYAMIVGIVISGAVAGISGSQAIPVDRHAEWADIAFAIIAAFAIGGMVGRLDDAPARRAIVAAGLIALIGLNAAIAFPPPQLTDGFQEGFTTQDVSLASWASSELPAHSTLAADHRLSDLYFGLSGNPATWDQACYLFLGNASECGPAPANLTAAVLAELRLSQAPLEQFLHPIDAVAVDEVMLSTGVALNPSAPALKMSPTELAFLEGPDFVLLYQNGAQQVWWYVPTTAGPPAA